MTPKKLLSTSKNHSKVSLIKAEKSLDNIKLYSSLFKESYQVVVENGSKDQTREILKKNQSNGQCIHSGPDRHTDTINILTIMLGKTDF